MIRLPIPVTLILFLLFISTLLLADDLIESFPIQQNPIELSRPARPGNPFDKVGRKFAILGEEGGSFEAWAYPLKLFRNFEFAFLLGNSTRPIPARELVDHIRVTPEATVLTYVYQSFTVRAIYITPVQEPAAMILLDVQTTEPITIICSFLPVLQPMWPAGLGGQYARWDNRLKAYLLGEPTRQNHGLVGCPFASGITATPAHMLADSPNEFKIEISDPAAVRYKYIPIIMTGGKGSRDSLIAKYKQIQEDPPKYYQSNVEYYENLQRQTLQIATPDPGLDLAFQWAKVALDNLMVENPDLGLGLVAGLHASRTSGRPGFGWYFGGDAYMNFLSFNSFGYYSAVRDALAFTQKWQREDGKMAHELSQAAGYINWWKDYPYGFIHADTTPFYIVAMSDYYQMTGDLAFIKSGWNSLRKAYQWCLSTDANHDGLMDNQKAGLGASEYGELTGIETDVYLAAVWTRATREMQRLAQAVGDKKSAGQAAKDYEKALLAFQTKFWYPEGEFYAYAFNADGKHVSEISPWLSVSLMWHLGTAEATARSLQKLNSADMTTDWGVRLISSRSRFFNPVGYNYGAIWPFVTGWVTMAQFTHHHSLQGFNLLQANLRHTFSDQLGMMPEVLSGMFNIPLQESVSHQGFSSGGVLLPLVRGLLGLQGSAVERWVEFAPQFPPHWREVSIENYQLGDATFDFLYRRSENTVSCLVTSQQAANYTMRFAPVLGAGTEISAITKDQQDVPFKIAATAPAIQPVVEIPMTGVNFTLSMNYQPTVELIPPVNHSRRGDTNQGLKIISSVRQGKVLAVLVEGLTGQHYSIALSRPDLVSAVEGASLSGNTVQMVIPGETTGTFNSHQFSIMVK